MEYTTRKAAEYLGMSYDSFRYYALATKHIKKERRGRIWIFTKQTLDEICQKRDLGHWPPPPPPPPPPPKILKLPIGWKVFRKIKEVDHSKIMISPDRAWISLPLADLTKVLLDHAGLPEATLVGFRKTRQSQREKTVGVGYFHTNPISLFAETEAEPGQQIEILVKFK